jgi:hypothetical protein
MGRFEKARVGDSTQIGELHNGLCGAGPTTVRLQLLCLGDVRVLLNPFQQKFSLPKAVQRAQDETSDAGQSFV